MHESGPSNELLHGASGHEMLAGLGVGIIFAPALGPLGLMLCVVVGWVAGAMLSCAKSQRDAP